MSLYYLILWNQVYILQKHFKKNHVHMRLWTRFYGIYWYVVSGGATKVANAPPPPPPRKMVRTLFLSRVVSLFTREMETVLSSAPIGPPPLATLTRKKSGYGTDACECFYRKCAVQVGRFND